ncbi:hypothetical protein [Lysobacter sp. F6437]|uniref:hypothetical protein n=1 Tax=Lysobacter sp. F6437 TaxID=3459296 RepID=UPI00403DA2A1
MKREIPHDDASAANDGLTDALRWQLRALRRDELPAADPWPTIAARLAGPRAESLATPSAHPAGPRWAMPVALAATLAIALGFAGWWQGASSPAAPSLVQQEANGLTLQYQAAFAEVDALPASATLAVQPAFDELDRSARLILDALARDPDSRLLLEQLRRTYSHRLALAQRVVLG